MTSSLRMGETWKTKSLEWTEDDSPARDFPYSRTGMEWTDEVPATGSFPYFGKKLSMVLPLLWKIAYSEMD